MYSHLSANFIIMNQNPEDLIMKLKKQNVTMKNPNVSETDGVQN